MQAVGLQAIILTAVDQLAEQASQSDNIGNSQKTDVSQENAEWLNVENPLNEPAEEPQSSQEGSLDANASEAAQDIPQISELAEDAMDAQGAQEDRAANDTAQEAQVQALQWQLRSGHEFGHHHH